MISEIPGIIGFGVLSVLFLWIGRKNGFFSARADAPWVFPIRWYHVATVFAIYFSTVSIAIPILASVLKHKTPSISSIGIATWMNFLTSTLIAFAIAIYVFCIPRTISLKVWRRNIHSSYLEDFKFAAIAWIISFPFVIFLNQLFDSILHAISHSSALPDQLAVRFLKMTFNDPLYFCLTITTVVVLAPIIEETLFRGFLQSFIRQHFGSKISILLTAFCFSFFHYSPEQGLANISIIGSLFVFALFLGFVYDRQGSLAASMALHSYFNTINVINLYFLGEFPTGSIP